MKIVDIRTTGVAVPAPASDTALGHFDTYNYAIVEVLTDEGVTGLGEISTLWDGDATVQRAIVEAQFKHTLRGCDPRDINACLVRMATLVESMCPARAGIEMALFDILGKSLGVPVYRLLGGRVRDRIALSRSVFYRADVAQMVNDAVEHVRDGFTCLKVKIGRPQLKDDVRAVSSIREAVGDTIQLRVDANMGWKTPKDAVRAIKALEPYGLHSVEQPLPRGPVAQLRYVRDAVDVPIMADESVWGPDEALELLVANAVDYLNVYVAESGGLTNSSLIIRMAELAGVPCVIGAMPELGIGTAAAIHLAASVPNIGAPCDASGAMYQTDDVVEPWMQVSNGYVSVPEGDGLGITLNRDALARLTTDE